MVIKFERWIFEYLNAKLQFESNYKCKAPATYCVKQQILSCDFLLHILLNWGSDSVLGNKVAETYKDYPDTNNEIVHHLLGQVLQEKPDLNQLMLCKAVCQVRQKHSE